MKKAWHQNFKVGAKNRREADGYTFDSVAEKRRYQELKFLEKGAHILNLQVQKRFELVSLCGKYKVLTPTGKIAAYTADFVYDQIVSSQVGQKTGQVYDIAETVIEDVKGYADKTSALRIAVFEALTGNRVTIIKKK